MTSAERSAAVPDVPTVREAASLPDYEVIAWFTLFAPAGTPADRIALLNRAVQAALATEEMRSRLAGALGMTVRALDARTGRRLRPGGDHQMDQRHPPGRDRAAIALDPD